MTTYLGKSCSFGLLRVPLVNCRQFMYLVISLLVLRAGCGIWLYQFLIIAYLFTLSYQRYISNMSYVGPTSKLTLGQRSLSTLGQPTEWPTKMLRWPNVIMLSGIQIPCEWKCFKTIKRVLLVKKSWSKRAPARTLLDSYPMDNTREVRKQTPGNTQYCTLQSSTTLEWIKGLLYST